MDGLRCQVTVLDGDPALLPQKGGRSPPIFGPYPWWPNGWMYQDGTWHGGARRGPSSPPKKGSGVPCPIFGPFLLWTNGWIRQDATWYGGIAQATLCSMGTQLPKNECSAVADMGDRLATRYGPKIGGGAVPPFETLTRTHQEMK